MSGWHFSVRTGTDYIRPSTTKKEEPVFVSRSSWAADHLRTPLLRHTTTNTSVPSAPPTYWGRIAGLAEKTLQCLLPSTRRASETVRNAPSSISTPHVSLAPTEAKTTSPSIADSVAAGQQCAGQPETGGLAETSTIPAAAQPTSSNPPAPIIIHQFFHVDPATMFFPPPAPQNALRFQFPLPARCPRKRYRSQSAVKTVRTQQIHLTPAISATISASTRKTATEPSAPTSERRVANSFTAAPNKPTESLPSKKTSTDSTTSTTKRTSFVAPATAPSSGFGFGSGSSGSTAASAPFVSASASKPATTGGNSFFKSGPSAVMPDDDGFAPNADDEKEDKSKSESKPEGSQSAVASKPTFSFGGSATAAPSPWKPSSSPSSGFGFNSGSSGSMAASASFGGLVSGSTASGNNAGLAFGSATPLGSSSSGTGGSGFSFGGFSNPFGSSGK